MTKTLLQIFSCYCDLYTEIKGKDTSPRRNDFLRTAVELSCRIYPPVDAMQWDTQLTEVQASLLLYPLFAREFTPRIQAKVKEFFSDPAPEVEEDDESGLKKIIRDQIVLSENQYLLQKKFDEMKGEILRLVITIKTEIRILKATIEGEDYVQVVDVLKENKTTPRWNGEVSKISRDIGEYCRDKGIEYIPHQGNRYPRDIIEKFIEQYTDEKTDNDRL